MKINKINLLINTIKYLKFRQIFYRFYYSFKCKTFQNFNRSINSVQTLKFNQFLIHSNFSYSNNSFIYDFIGRIQYEWHPESCHSLARNHKKDIK